MSKEKVWLTLLFTEPLPNALVSKENLINPFVQQVWLKKFLLLQLWLDKFGFSCALCYTFLSKWSSLDSSMFTTSRVGGTSKKRGWGFRGTYTLLAFLKYEHVLSFCSWRVYIFQGFELTNEQQWLRFFLKRWLSRQSRNNESEVKESRDANVTQRRTNHHTDPKLTSFKLEQA